MHSGITVAIIYSISIINHLAASQMRWSEPYLIDQSTTMDISCLKDLTPKVCLTPLNEVPCLLLEHRIFVGDRNELVVTKALRDAMCARYGSLFSQNLPTTKGS